MIKACTKFLIEKNDFELIFAINVLAIEWFPNQSSILVRKQQTVLLQHNILFFSISHS